MEGESWKKGGNRRESAVGVGGGIPIGGENQKKKKSKKPSQNKLGAHETGEKRKKPLRGRTRPKGRIQTRPQAGGPGLIRNVKKPSTTESTPKGRKNYTLATLGKMGGGAPRTVKEKGYWRSWTNFKINLGKTTTRNQTQEETMQRKDNCRARLKKEKVGEGQGTEKEENIECSTEKGHVRQVGRKTSITQKSKDS